MYLVGSVMFRAPCLFIAYLCGAHCEFAFEPGTFYIRHHFGKCLEYDQTRHVFAFTSVCREKFRWSSGAKLFHIPSGKLAGTNSTKDGSYLVLSYRNTSASNLFQYDESKRTIIHLLSRRCLRPEAVSNDAGLETAAILKSGCNESANKFYFRQQAYYTIRHFGGLCWMLGSHLTLKLKRYSACNRFHFENGSILKGVETGYCVTISNGYVKLDNSCNSLPAVFTPHRNSTIRINATHCVQPHSGRINPPVYDMLVAAPCAVQDYQKFDFLDDKDILRVKLVSESCDDLPVGSACNLAKGFITVNGFQYSLNTRGINIVVFDYKSGLYEHRSSYDVRGYQSACGELAAFLNNLSPGKIVFMVSKDSVFFDSRAASALQKFGVSARFARNNPPKAQISMATVAYSGTERKHWEQSVYNVDGNGASILEAVLYLFRDSGGMNDCSNEIGVHTRRFPNSRFSAESVWGNDDYYHMPYRARLHGGHPGWCSSSGSSLSDFIQVDLGGQKMLTGIAMQCHGTAAAHCVTKFKLQYSVDKAMWSYYVDSKSRVVEFQGLNVYSAIETKVNWFERTILRFLRIIPSARLTTSDTSCLRFELYGCSFERPIFMYDGANDNITSVCYNRSLSIYYTMHYKSSVVYGYSASIGNNQSMASSIDLLFTKLNGQCRYDGGNLETESMSVFATTNEKTGMDSGGYFQFRIAEPNDYSIKIDFAAKVLGLDATATGFWGVSSIETAERITIIGTPRISQRVLNDQSILQLNFTNFGTEELIDGQFFQVNVSLTHIVGDLCRRHAGAYLVDLFIYFDSSFIELQSMKTIKMDRLSLPPDSISTKPGRIHVHTDKFGYYHNQHYALELKMTIPKALVKGSRCRGVFIVDFKYLANSLEANGTLVYTAGKLLAYKCRITEWKGNSLTPVRIHGQKLSMVFNNLSGNFFFCLQKEQHSKRGRVVCFWQGSDSFAWHGITNLVSILGIDVKAKVLYGLNQEKFYLMLFHPFTEVFHIENSEWERGQNRASFQQSFVVSDTSMLPLSPESNSTLSAFGKEVWTATRSGILKKKGEGWNLRVAY